MTSNRLVNDEVASASLVSEEEIAETIDAVTGATWNTRNRIMQDLFQRDLERHGDAMPAFKPAGS